MLSSAGCLQLAANNTEPAAGVPQSGAVRRLPSPLARPGGHHLAAPLFAGLCLRLVLSLCSDSQEQQLCLDMSSAQL